MSFSSKPIIVGGLAMEYYGLRKCGDDIDFIITDEDYQSLAKKYPDCTMDTWGDLLVEVSRHQFFRSISRLDYSFYSENAIEYSYYKVISFERLFFMKAAAVRSQPEIKKHEDDFGFVIGYCYDNYRNQEYVANAELHTSAYMNAPNGVIFGGKY
jgi:hypothetical protein